jgi:uncharacterized protein YhjY with autotransporter beta-barrel domain
MAGLDRRQKARWAWRVAAAATASRDSLNTTGRRAAFRWRHTRFQGLKHRVSDLAKDVELQARARALQIKILNASTIREIDAAFTTLESERVDALFVAGEAFFTSRRSAICGARGAPHDSCVHL